MRPDSLQHRVAHSARRRIALWMLPTCFVLLGCTRSDKATVSGVVNVDGQPAQLGYVTFIAIDGRAPTAGGPIHNGRFTTEVKPGRCKVQIRIPKEAGQKKLYDTPEAPMRKAWVESLPARYNDATELTFNVQPGTNECNYDVKSK